MSNPTRNMKKRKKRISNRCKKCHAKLVEKAPGWWVCPECGYEMEVEE